MFSEMFLYHVLLRFVPSHPFWRFSLFFLEGYDFLHHQYQSSCSISPVLKSFYLSMVLFCLTRFEKFFLEGYDFFFFFFWCLVCISVRFFHLIRHFSPASWGETLGTGVTLFFQSPCQPLPGRFVSCCPVSKCCLHFTWEIKQTNK